MSELVRYIAQNLVDQPDQVSVQSREEGESLTYELRVAQEDLGKVIGKQGRTAKAIRAVMAASQTDDRRARLEIVED
ncbi:MAG: KH domain-containing protein [bacterium]|nr:KH domain-containing protein [bacterium]